MRLLIAGLCFLFFTQSGKTQQEDDTDTRLSIHHLVDSFFVYTSYGEFQGVRYPANGLYVVTKKGVVLIDEPWNPSDYAPLLDSIEARHHQKVVLCLATHFHEDRTGGLNAYKKLGIPTYSTVMTDSLSKLRGTPRAQFLMHSDTTFKIGGLTLAVFYPGQGHAPDNIVVWFPKQKVLYGGCFYKSVADGDLGNLEDADVAKWKTSIERVRARFGQPKYLIVGHNSWTDLSADLHTLQMVNRYLQTHK